MTHILRLLGFQVLPILDDVIRVLKYQRNVLLIRDIQGKEVNLRQYDRIDGTQAEQTGC